MKLMKIEAYLRVIKFSWPVLFLPFFLVEEIKAQIVSRTIHCPADHTWCSCVARNGFANNPYVAPTYNRLCRNKASVQHGTPISKQRQLEAYRKWQAEERKKLQKLRRKYREQVRRQKLLKGYTLKQQINCCIRYHRKGCQTGLWENGTRMPSNVRAFTCQLANRRSCREAVINRGGRYCGS